MASKPRHACVRFNLATRLWSQRSRRTGRIARGSAPLLLFLSVRLSPVTLAAMDLPAASAFRASDHIRGVTQTPDGSAVFVDQHFSNPEASWAVHPLWFLVAARLVAARNMGALGSMGGRAHTLLAKRVHCATRSWVKAPFEIAGTGNQSAFSERRYFKSFAATFRRRAGRLYSWMAKSP